MTERARRRLIVVLFVLSGAASLMYEVVWARQLVLVFGNTTQAVSAILTGFFGGMAVGAYLGGRLADRLASPVRLYAAAEVALGCVALLTPLMFSGIRELYRSVYPDLASSPTVLGFVRFGLAVAAVAPATVLMGATLPSLIRHLTRSVDQVGGQFGRLYAANTLGGIVGTAAAGYVLIELIGLQATVWVGAGTSITAGAGALWLSARLAVSVKLRSANEGAGRSPRVSSVLRRSLVLVVAFASGLTSLGYQVLWTRLMSSGTTNSTYVFTTILLLFLTGIALGAHLHGRGLGRGIRAIEALGASQLAVALIAFAGLFFLGDPDVSVLAWLGVLLPATIVMGFALPLAAGLLVEDGYRAGSDSGLILAVNTAGTVLGTFVVPFFLLPAVGSGWSIVYLALANAMVGVLLFAVAARSNPPYRLAVVIAAALVAAIIVTPISNPQMTLNPAARAVIEQGTLFATAEDEIASIQAGELRDGRHLWVGGVSMTVISVETKFMPLLPLAARPQSETALIVAFGMGTSHRTALIAGLETHSVELVPSVPGMFGYYYADAAEVLADPRGRVFIADGRNYLALTDRRYDMVISDPPPPIRSAGTGVLYTKEFYEAAAARLNEGGVVMQWMPHDQTVDELRAHLRTFDEVFEHVMYVLSPAGLGVYMLGSDEDIILSEASLRHILNRPGILHDVNSAGDVPPASSEDWVRWIRSLVWLADAEARDFAGGGPLITDDRPLTEYFLLRSVADTGSPWTSHETLKAASVP